MSLGHVQPLQNSSQTSPSVVVLVVLVVSVVLGSVMPVDDSATPEVSPLLASALALVLDGPSELAPLLPAPVEPSPSLVPAAVVVVMAVVPALTDPPNEVLPPSSAPQPTTTRIHAGVDRVIVTSISHLPVVGNRCGV